MAHPAQRRDDKVTVSRFSPRARGCDPNGSLQRGSRKRERSAHLGCAISCHTRARARRKIGTRSEEARERKNGRKVGGGLIPRSALIPSTLFLDSLHIPPPIHFFPMTSLIYLLKLNEIKRFSYIRL